MAVGLLGVVDGRHKIVPVVAPGQQPAVCRQKIIIPLRGGGFHHQHPEHLSVVGILLAFGMAADVGLYLPGCQLAKRMRLVGKGVGEAFGALDVGM